jgi:hypothetical protein
MSVYPLKIDSRFNVVLHYILKQLNGVWRLEPPTSLLYTYPLSYPVSKHISTGESYHRLIPKHGGVEYQSVWRVQRSDGFVQGQ